MIWMNKRKSVAVFLLAVLIVGAVLAANGCKTVYGISQGTYEKRTQEAYVPVIYFDMSAEPTHFWMAADKRVSFAYRGTVELKNGYAYLHVENGGQVWAFEVADNDTIVFTESKSDECKLAKEGDTFLLQKN